MNKPSEQLLEPSGVPAVIVRVAGAYCIFKSLDGFALFPYYLAPSGEASFAAILSQSGLHAVYGISGILLWFLAKPIATKLTGGKFSSAYSMDAENLVAAGSFLVGLYWVMAHLQITLMLTVAHVGYLLEPYPHMRTDLPAVAWQWVNIFVGISVMVGFRSLVRAFRWLRKADGSVSTG